MVGVFFGSFDPPHIGHVNIVTAALNSGIVAPNDTPGFVLSHQDTVLGSDCVYLKGEWIADPLDFLNVEQPKSYFY